MSVMAFFTSSTLTLPSLSTGRYVTSAPSYASRYSAVCRIAWCSMLVVMMWFLPLCFARSRVPFNAQLSASVPEPVKNISDGSAFSAAATWPLAFSIAALLLRENEYTLDGFPNTSPKYGIIADNTSGLVGVVAVWSRYTNIYSYTSLDAFIALSLTSSRSGSA